MTRRLALVAIGLLLPGTGRAQPTQARIDAGAEILGELIETYGVSGDEDRVRAVIERHLPEWARPRTDSAGNLWVRAGSGDPVAVFVAHMDETGFEVTEILDDGALQLRGRGGFMARLWEATPAYVHTAGGPVAGVFTPRVDAGDAFTRNPPFPGRGRYAYQVDVGTGSRAGTEALGVAVGDKVTNPKRFVRLADNRATGRSFDDRVGSTAQILALQQLDPNALDHEVIFLWVVEEETGLIGSRIAAEALGFEAARVYAIDTFVSSDSPLDAQQFAVTPIGQGPVARAVDNSSVTPPAVLDTLLSIVRGRGLPIQVGTTNGGNDGSAFAAWGVVDIPIGWPLRYSHSPIEVIDLRDLVTLSDVIVAIVEEW